IRRNDIAREGVTDRAAAVRIRTRGIRVKNRDELRGAGSRGGEVARAFEIRGDGGEAVRETAFTQTFERAHEEGAILVDRAADHPAELIPLEAAKRRAALVGEEIVSVEDGVSQEFIRAAVQVVAAGFIDHVQHSGDAASELGAEVLRLHFEFFYGIDRGE